LHAAFFNRFNVPAETLGERRKLEKILDPIAGLRGFGDILQTICDKLGVKMGTPSTAPCENLFSSKISPDLAKQVQVEEV
jgi:hypothetical protein